MKKLFYKIPGFAFALFFFLIVHCTLYIENCSAQWVQMANGMGNITVWAMASDGNNIYAGTIGTGVFLSTDYGANWTQTSLNNREIRSLAVNGNTIYAGTQGYGVYFSTNNGTNWTQTALNNKRVWALAVNGNNIFAGDNGSSVYGVFLSTNNGTTWAQTSLNNRYIYSLAISGNNILAGTSAYGIYLSTNNGTNWGFAGLTNMYVKSLAINNINVFAGTAFDYGLSISTNNGISWTQTSLPNWAVDAIITYGNNVFAGPTSSFNGLGVVLSTDNGISWNLINEGFSSLPIIAYSFCIANNYIFAGVGTYGVWRRPLSEVITGIIPVSNQTPNEFSLSQNYPNPFNPETKIKFNIAQHTPYPLSRGEFTTLKVFDILGKEEATLVNEKLNPGSYEVTFDGSNYPSGVYYYKLTSGNYIETKKMLMIK